MSELTLNIIAVTALYAAIFACVGVVIYIAIRLSKMKDEK